MARLSTLLKTLALLGASLGVSVACTGGELEQAEPEPTLQTERVAVVSLTWRPGEAGLAQAYAVDHAPGERKAALDQLGVLTAGLLLESSLGLDPDGTVASPGLLADQCRVDRTTNTSSPVLLRDMGEILISTGATQQVLDFTWLPEGSLGASGAAYSGRVSTIPTATRGKTTRDLRAPISTQSASQKKRDPRVVTVAADGSHELGAFTASTTLPDEVHLLSVGGLPVRAGRVQRAHLEASAALDLTSSPTGLEVIWARSPRSDQAEARLSPDLTLVLFERVGFGETWTIACASEDDGAFVIPAAALIGLPDLGAYQTDRVVVRRVAGASFSARALPEGLLLVASEDQAYLE